MSLANINFETIKGLKELKLERNKVFKEIKV